MPLAILLTMQRRTVGMLTVAVACLSLLLAPPAGAARETRIAGVVYLGDLPTVVAEHEALFARHGVDARIAFNLSGRDNLGRLRAGRTDFALMALTPFVLDLLADDTPNQPDDPIIVANLVHSTALNHVVSVADRGIRTPADLAGRRIGLARGTSSEFVWWLFAHFHGLDPAATEVVDRPVANIPEALASGDIDAAVVWEPWLSHLQERLQRDLMLFPGADIYTGKWVLVTTRRLAAAEPGLVRDVLAGYGDAIDFIEAEPEHAIEEYARRADTSTGLLREQWQELDHDLNLDWSLLTAIRQQLDWARSSGYPAAGGEPHVLDCIDSGPLRALRPAAVGIPRKPDSEGAAQ